MVQRLNYLVPFLTNHGTEIKLFGSLLTNHGTEIHFLMFSLIFHKSPRFIRLELQKMLALTFLKTFWQTFFYLFLIFTVYLFIYLRNVPHFPFILFYFSCIICIRRCFRHVVCCLLLWNHSLMTIKLIIYSKLSYTFPL
jgi:hypothetical protein